MAVQPHDDGLCIDDSPLIGSAVMASICSKQPAALSTVSLLLDDEEMEENPCGRPLDGDRGGCGALPTSRGRCGSGGGGGVGVG